MSIKFESDGDAIRYLTKRRWHLTSTFHWTKPHENYLPTLEELEAIRYLIDEWDYGGIVDKK